MKWAEVAPFAPLLIPLAEVLLWSLTLAICLASGYIVKAFFGFAGGIVSRIPVVGGLLGGGLHSIEQHITNVLSGAALSVDHKLGAAMHAVAREVDWIGREIRRHANLLELVAEILTGTVGLSLLQKAIRDLIGRIHVNKATADIAVKRTTIIEKRIERGIGEDVLPRLRSLDRELGRIEGRVIPGIAGEVQGLERGATRTWDWILRHPRTVASTAFAGAVAWAIARLGMGWTRCNNWNRIGREVCSTPLNDIEGFLGIALGAAAIADLRDLVKIAQSVEKVTAEGVKDLLQV